VRAALQGGMLLGESAGKERGDAEAQIVSQLAEQG
jgi:hypothetical protein